MTDTLQLELLGAILFAFVVIGCLMTRAPKNLP